MKEGYKKFYEMDLWIEAQKLQKEIFEITKNFPRNEDFGLTSQCNRATASVLANMAESHGRFHFADKIRVLYIARGEIEEIQSHLIVSGSRAYITKEISKNLILKYEEVKKKLNRYISNLYSQMNTKEARQDKETN